MGNSQDGTGKPKNIAAKYKDGTLYFLEGMTAVRVTGNAKLLLDGMSNENLSITVLSLAKDIEISLRVGNADIALRTKDTGVYPGFTSLPRADNGFILRSNKDVSLVSMQAIAGGQSAPRNLERKEVLELVQNAMSVQYENGFITRADGSKTEVCDNARLLFEKMTEKNLPIPIHRTSEGQPYMSVGGKRLSFSMDGGAYSGVESYTKQTAFTDSKLKPLKAKEILELVAKEAIKQQGEKAQTPRALKQ